MLIRKTSTFNSKSLKITLNLSSIMKLASTYIKAKHMSLPPSDHHSSSNIMISLLLVTQEFTALPNLFSVNLTGPAYSDMSSHMSSPVISVSE